ncbi:FAD-dependent oxidoreductase [Streptomyces sp. NBC_00344]|uniref:FAD-dependent oxidoreductase n=1 Tax=Streptomyces sp. NBC_00344 TaxID=2975720 RepID=UPI002E1D825B
MRVIVIGAGIGGLALAQGLLQAGVDVRLFERESAVDSRYQGFRIVLDERGAGALRECLPDRLHDVLHATTGELAGSRRVVDPRLNEISQLGDVTGGTATDRYVLRHLLLTGLRDRIEFGKHLIGSTESHEGTVRADFADGSSTEGDILVGADGVASTVRRQLLPHAEVVTLSGSSFLGRTPVSARSAHLVPGFGTVVRGESASMLIGKMEFRCPPHLAAGRHSDVALPVTPDYLRWVVSLPDRPAPFPSEWAEIRELLLHVVRDWHPDLVELVKQSDVINGSPLKVRYAKAVPPWRTGRVTLMGDAVHVMPPSGGQGANTAFRDASLLSRSLIAAHRGESELLPAVEAYERQMIDYGFAAVAESLNRLPDFKATRD